MQEFDMFLEQFKMHKAYSILIMIRFVSQSHLKHLPPEPVNRTRRTLEAIHRPWTANSTVP